jgi:ABC-type glycerol-3-phosphate transport system substrate-binding protein
MTSVLHTAAPTRRRALRTVGSGALGLALAACASLEKTNAPQAAAAPATIQFWPTWQGQFQVDGMTKMAQAFHAEQPNLSVEIVPYAGKYEKIVAAVSGGTPPDMHSLPGDQMGPFARQKLTQTLDSRLAKGPLKERFYPAQWEVASRDGKVYGVPAWDHHPTPFLFWNQAHFEEVGIPADKPPATLDEARRLAERMTKFGPEGIGRLGFDPVAESGNGLLGYWASAYNVTWYDPKTRKINLGQPGLVSALEYISGLYKFYSPDQVQAYRQKFPTFNSPNAGMPQGMESMKVSSGVSTGTLANNAPQIRVGIGWAPAEKARKSIQVGGGHFNCLSTGAPSVEAAWQFVEWLTTPTANQLLMESVGWIAYNKELGKGLDLRKFPNMRFVLDSPAKADQVTAPVVLPISLVPMEAGVQRVIRGQQGPREMLADVQKQLQNDLDEALKQG